MRKIDIVAFVWTLVLGFGDGSVRTIAGLRRALERSTGVHVVPSAFYDRFNRQLVNLLKSLVHDVIDQLIPPAHGIGGAMEMFREILLTDSTVIRLHDLLKNSFAACRTNHTKAAAKLHVILNVAGRGMQSFKITSERVHDGPVLRAGNWVRDKLLMFDLGYYRFQLFDRIDTCGGFFVSRLKEGANPIITAINVGTGPFVGCPLQFVLANLRRPVVDFEVEVNFSRREYAGSRSKARARFRLCGIRNPLTGRYHLYLTNIPVEKMSAEEISKLYSLRWTIELLFRELKGCYRLDDMPSAKKVVVDSLIYASILTLAASRALYRAVSKWMKERANRMPVERWAVVFTSAADEVLLALVGSRDLRAALDRHVFRFLCHEAVDPNAGRLLLMQRACGKAA
jgi:IS4 transposase